ncbi:MAG: hypothetical protein MUF28_13075 [Ignavibacterium sp.]|jgi:hypothetical protein|nr:hypothetical protein [Ignavibacterium sp.]
MSKVNRIKFIKEIEEKRKSKVLVYVTSTRHGLEVQMAMDTIRKFYDHLVTIKESDRGKILIDLFIVSNGGDGTVPWRLVTLLREYCNKLSVLIPYKAFSAATLTALGADSIIMHPMGMLGPTDPTVANEFNPVNPTNPGQKIGISVEDVTAYISLIKEDAGITHEDELVVAFNKLAENIHPLALGNVKRSISQSRMMAQKLLSLHMNKVKEQHEIKEIVDNLTSKLFYHGHPINRKEAKEEIGLKNVEFPDNTLEKLMWDLYIQYENEMKTEYPFDPVVDFIEANPDLQPNQTASFTTTNKLCFIESIDKTDYFEITHSIEGMKQPNGRIQITPNVLGRGWRVE